MFVMKWSWSVLFPGRANLLYLTHWTALSCVKAFFQVEQMWGFVRLLSMKSSVNPVFSLLLHTTNVSEGTVVTCGTEVCNFQALPFKVREWEICSCEPQGQSPSPNSGEL